ncbi:MAG: hypothetical protein A6F71_01265 [Cycloclasticus sp. symbiont of Poecilosclerida sp. M]|nr:MAG: hypothetical protein A6F71_01265 [Cycloclasticus sp. symbiont of Poecilosclerida sp. M]
MNRRRQNRNKTKSLYLWHKYIGLTVALFVLLLSLTGVALNHTGDLQLDKSYLSSGWLLAHYNVSNPSYLKSFSADTYAVSQVDDLLIIDQHIVAPIERPLIGAVTFHDFILVALKGQLLLVDSDYNVVEKIGRNDGVPILLNRVGKTDSGQLLFETPSNILSVDENFIQWSPLDIDFSKWSAAQALSKNQQSELNQLYKSHVIQLETLVLDLHSGRFFGRYGELFFDFIALLLIFLAGTGIWIWLRQRSSHQSH